MTVRVYKSDDSGAPVLNGTVGSLLAVLRACLVTGYGSQTAAGWSEPFTSASNVAVFRNGTGSTQTYFRVVDDGTIGTAAAREAQIWAYSAMTALGTGSNVSPSANTNNAIRKSATADVIQRSWKIIASERAVHLLTAPMDYDALWSWHSFGDFVNYNPSYNTGNAYIVARPVNSSLQITSRSPHSGPLSVASIYNVAAQSVMMQVPGVIPSKGINHHILLNDGTGYDKRFSVIPGNCIVDEAWVVASQYWIPHRFIGITGVGGFYYASSASANTSAIASGLPMRNGATSLIPCQVYTYAGSEANSCFLGAMPGMYEGAGRGMADGQVATFTNYPNRTFLKVELSGGYTTQWPGFYIETTSTATW